MRPKRNTLYFRMGESFLRWLVAEFRKERPESKLTRDDELAMVTLSMLAIEPRIFLDAEAQVATGLADYAQREKAKVMRFFVAHTDLSLDFMQYVRSTDPVKLFLGASWLRNLGHGVLIESMTDGEVSLAIKKQIGLEFSEWKVKSTRQDMGRDLSKFVRSGALRETVSIRPKGKTR